MLPAAIDSVAYCRTERLHFHAMFRLCVDVLRSQRMKQELLACDRVLEAVEQPTPAEVVVDVLGGDAAVACLMLLSDLAA